MWKQLKKWFENASSKAPITMDLILRQYEGQEELIDWDRIPPQIEDFPLDVQKAVASYSKFQDNVYPEVGYLGKDFVLYPHIRDMEVVRCEDIYLEALLRLDSFYIEKYRKDMEMARKQAKHGGK